MKTQAMSHWNIFERFLFPTTKTLSKVKSAPIPSFTDKGYIEKLRNSAPIHVPTDTYTPQNQTIDLPVPAAVEFFRWFSR